MKIKVDEHPTLEVPQKMEKEVMGLIQKIMFPTHRKTPIQHVSKRLTTEEDKMLVAEWESHAVDQTTLEFATAIAEKLGRTVSSVSSRLNTLGYK